MTQCVPEYRVEELNSCNAGEWERFNETTESGGFFHSLKWKRILERSCMLKPHYFLIYRADEVVAICPFFENQVKQFKGLVSLPYSDFCHVAIAGGHANGTMVRQIYETCVDIAQKENLAFLQISANVPSITDILMQYAALPPFVSGNFVLNLEELPPEVILNATRSGKGSQKTAVDTVFRNEYTIQEILDLKDLELFYHYYNQHLRQDHARANTQTGFFTTVWDICSPADMRITLMKIGDAIYGGLFSYLYPPNKTIYLVHLACNRNIPGSCDPSYALLQESIVNAYERGYRKLSFGGNSYNAEYFLSLQKKGIWCEYQYTYSVFISQASFPGYGHHLLNTGRKEIKNSEF